MSNLQKLKIVIVKKKQKGFMSETQTVNYLFKPCLCVYKNNQEFFA